MLRLTSTLEKRLSLRYTPTLMLPISLLYIGVKVALSGTKLGIPEARPPQVVVFNCSAGAKISNPLQTHQMSMGSYSLSTITVKVLRYTFPRVPLKPLTRLGQLYTLVQRRLQKGQRQPLPRQRQPLRVPPKPVRNSRRRRLRQRRTTILLSEVVLEALWLQTSSLRRARACC